MRDVLNDAREYCKKLRRALSPTAARFVGTVPHIRLFALAHLLTCPRLISNLTSELIYATSLCTLYPPQKQPDLTICADCTAHVGAIISAALPHGTWLPWQRSGSLAEQQVGGAAPVPDWFSSLVLQLRLWQNVWHDPRGPLSFPTLHTFISYSLNTSVCKKSIKSQYH